MKSDEDIHYNSRKLITDPVEIKRIDDMARFIEEDIARAKNPSQTKTRDQPTPSDGAGDHITELQRLSTAAGFAGIRCRRRRGWC